MRARMTLHTLTVAAVAAVLLLGGLAFMPRLLAQTAVDLNAADAIRSAVSQQVGQRVRLKLVSGQDLEGQVARVGSNAVALTQLTGMELFDATVRLDQVAAVIVRRAK
jgi:hypothetical protein